MPGGTPVPIEIRRLGAPEIRITWSDGHVGTYPNPYLRAACPCAHCRDAGGAANVREDVRAIEIEPVGGYAVGIRWSDGHGAGIYTWPLLRGLCPCQACSAVRGRG